MKILLQRVQKAIVSSENQTIGSINNGLLLFLGVGKNDTENEIEYLCEKILNLRIFTDEQGKMNKSLLDISGEILIISQFTLYANCEKGRRPSFIESADPSKANDLYEKFIAKLRKSEIKVETGKFGAMMNVNLVNDGPVTILLER